MPWLNAFGLNPIQDGGHSQLTLENTKMDINSFTNSELKLDAVVAENNLHFMLWEITKQFDLFLKLPLTNGVDLICLLAKFVMSHWPEFNNIFRN